MNFMDQKMFSGSGGGSHDENKEENDQQQQPPTLGPLLLSSSSYHHPQHHHHQDSVFSPSRYNYNHLHRGGEKEEQEQGWNNMTVEREHMFDKVVTPSDVGKLNRLVIPKQHAERYFPLDSSTNYKGLLLNFEDRNGKLWRFQYSYWNSSQSYVMTKGWSRFVKEKTLDAGDIVSFQRGVGVNAKDRLFIDWKRRVVNPSSSSHHQLISSSSDLSFLFQNHNFINPFNNPVIFPARRNPDFMLHTPNINNPNNIRTGSRSVYFGAQPQQFGLGFDPPVATVASTPPVHGKRLRLFGVNMDCCPGELKDDTVAGYGSSSSFSSSTIPYLQLRSEYEGKTDPCDESTIEAHDFNVIGKSTGSNMCLDLKM